MDLPGEESNAQLPGGDPKGPTLRWVDSRWIRKTDSGWVDNDNGEPVDDPDQLAKEAAEQAAAARAAAMAGSDDVTPQWPGAMAASKGRKTRGSAGSAGGRILLAFALVAVGVAPVLPWFEVPVLGGFNLFRLTELIDQLKELTKAFGIQPSVDLQAIPPWTVWIPVGCAAVGLVALTLMRNRPFGARWVVLVAVLVAGGYYAALLWFFSGKSIGALKDVVINGAFGMWIGLGGVVIALAVTFTDR